MALILEVAEKRSFTEAAQTTHLSQSALSRAVNESERRLDARLFHRTTRSVEPTPVGEEFLRIARSILADYERGLHEFALYRDGLGGVVRVATLPSVAATVLPSVVAELKHEAPGLDIDIEDTLAHIAIEQLLEGHVNLAITVDDGLPDTVEFTPLASDRFQVVFRADHPFHGRDEVAWAELVDEPLAVFGVSSSIRTLTDATFADLGRAPEHTVEARNIAVIAGLVAAGLGVAAAPMLALPLMLFADLKSAPLVHPTVDRTLGLVHLPDRPLTPAARLFADRVAAAVPDVIGPPGSG
ncbi:LysR family transcriptional regulator [Nocardia callitridis]